MKKLVSIIILCLACLGGLEAQHYWKPIGMQGIFLGVSPDGSIYSYYGGSGNGPCFTRSQDEGETWQVVLGYETGFNCNFNWNCFSVSPEGRIFLFEGYPYRAFYSDDNGDTWQLTSGAAPLVAGDEAQQICAVNNETLVGVTSNYVFWTTDGGASWDTIRPAFIEDDKYIGDLLANGNGDVYFCLNLNNGAPSGNSAIGVYHATLSDMDHWNLVAFEGVSINDMEFDPEGNVVCNALVSDNFDGFEHVPGFYAFGSYNTFGVADNGIVYKSIETENNTAVLAYSMDHGETFTELGEELELEPPVPGGSDGYLSKGYDNFLYFKCRGLYWKSIFSANIIPNKFAPLGAEWYFNVSSFMGSPISYYRMEVLGDTIIQGHTCSVITQQFLGGNGQEQYVYEDNGKVYWYNQTLGRFTTLYDFDAEVGESWICEVDSCSFEIQVQSVEEETWEGHTYRVQHVYAIGEDEYNSFFNTGEGTIIEGIGEISGLFPYSGACTGDIYCGSSIEYLRCYLVDGEMLYHGGDYDCEEIVDVPFPSYPFAVGDLLYTIISDNPPQVSVYGHVNGDNAQGELDIPSTVTCEDVTYTVTEIGKWAFKNCSGLTGFAIPSTIDTIQEGAFYGCSGFTGTLDLSFSTVVFKENVFRDCTGFTDLILPLFISEIPQGLFCGCSGLTGTLVLPETVEIIGEYAFAKCSGYTGLVLPNGLREIREQAFSGCTGFTGNLVLPETVTHIKYGAFHDCSGFSGDLVLPNSVVEVGHTTNPIFNNMPLPDLYTSAFADCFDHLVLSQSLETIGMYCFAGCTRLTGDLVMPSGLKAIKDYAFAGCTGFNSLTLNDSLLLIGRDAFMACNGITGTLTIPENISLGLGAFEMCEGIEELDLPHNITFVDSENIKGGVFYRCTGLTEVDIPEGWIKIEQSTFAYCSNLRRVHLPESLISIEDGAFLECTNLEEINIPEGVTGIKDASFALCRSLTHIELPSTLRTLGSAFQRCTNLTGDMVIPDLVQKVNAYTFDSCNMLNRIVLGDSVNWISEPAFDYTELSSLVLKTMSPPQLWRHESPNAWHLPVDIPIIVPCGALEAYQNAEDWADFTNITENCDGGLIEFHGSEWYYEIQNENGSITYQHLEYVADTTINHKDVKIIIRTNTLYDKGEHNEVTREYVYREDQLVYWWNKDLQEFTVLYDLGAQEGDSWVIKVGTETLTMHVDAVSYSYYGGQLFKMLQVSDDQDLFSGTIVSGVGHLSSFFPERLMTRGKRYGVNGLRCYWRYGNLLFTVNRGDCDAIYTDLHNGIEEDGPSTGSGTLTVYPNPTNGILTIHHSSFRIHHSAFRITNLMGQTVQTGSLNAETQQIDVSDLPQGMYFISVGDMTRKFVVR